MCTHVHAYIRHIYVYTCTYDTVTGALLPGSSWLSAFVFIYVYIYICIMYIYMYMCTRVYVQHVYTRIFVTQSLALRYLAPRG